MVSLLAASSGTAPAVARPPAIRRVRSRPSHRATAGPPTLARHRRLHDTSRSHDTCRTTGFRVKATDGSDETAEVPSALMEPIPTKLNRVPHPRELRQYFYKLGVKSVKGAVEAGESRMQLRVTIPELNPEMDVYRIGTLLEMVREIAAVLAQDGLRVKVCVQQALGQGFFTGMPLSLSGVRRILEMMDWGEAASFVALGQVGEDQIDDETAVYILIAPQNVVNGAVIYELSDMVDAAEAKGKQVVLINPILKDVPSSGGMMGVRGRAERLDFANSFVSAGHFRLLYKAGTFYPIVGALRYVYGGPWEVSKRVDINKYEEQYQVIGSYDEEPDAVAITKCFEAYRKIQRKKEAEAYRARF